MRKGLRWSRWVAAVARAGVGGDCWPRGAVGLGLRGEGAVWPGVGVGSGTGQDGAQGYAGPMGTRGQQHGSLGREFAACFWVVCVTRFFKKNSKFDTEKWYQISGKTALSHTFSTTIW